MAPTAQITTHQSNRSEDQHFAALLTIGLLTSMGIACSPNAPTGSQDALVKTPQATTDTSRQSEASTSRSFREDSEVNRWMIINDGVMGGKSRSTLRAVSSGASFSGTLSSENGGGFASIRTALKQPPRSGLGAVAIRVRGDGNRYQFRVRTNSRFDGPAYVQTFETKPGSWQDLTLPLSDFQSSYRGRIVPGAAPLASEDIRQWGFLIANEQYGGFQLEIEEIKIL